MANIYDTTNTIDGWVELIGLKFDDLDFITRANDIVQILSIQDDNEIQKINKASLISYGKKLGVVSFEDACVKLGKPTTLPTFLGIEDDLISKYLVEYKIITIIKALNEGWYPNWSNSNEYKYFPYFYFEENSCVFSYCDTSYYYATAFVPSALLLKSKELATYCGLMFIKIYEEYYK
jgi:hypothetical protein